MTAGIEPPPGLASAVHEQTEGNPFFLGEVVRLLASEQRLDPDGRGDWELAIPQGVREVVGRRLDRLSEESNQVLAQAAAMGREFDVEVLAGVADCDRDRSTRALDEAVEARVLAELPRAPGAIHLLPRARARDALRGDPRGAQGPAPRRDRRARWRRATATTSSSHLAEIAHHLLEAAPGGDVDERSSTPSAPPRAHPTSSRTRRPSSTSSARSRHPTRRAGAARERRLRLLLALGEARTKAGRFAAARETLDEAADLGAASSATTTRSSRATLGMVTVAEAGGVDERVLALVRRSLEKVGDADSRERSLLLTGLAQELYWQDPTGEAKAALDEAIEIARRVGDEPALAMALSRRQFDLTANAARAPRDGHRAARDGASAPAPTRWSCAATPTGSTTC